MKKVKMMYTNNATELEIAVNEFIRGKVVTDIQFRPTSRSSSTSYAVMIVYEGGSDD